MGFGRIIAGLLGAIIFGPVLFLIVGFIMVLITGGFVLALGVPGILVFAVICLWGGWYAVISNLEKQDKKDEEDRLRKAAIAKLDEEDV